jgi:hypothetical protein
MTPPKVDGAPKPTSSVMISRTLGAFSGAPSVGGQAGVLSRAEGLMVPAKGAGGCGRTREFGNSTAVAEPGVPRRSCAAAGASGPEHRARMAKRIPARRIPDTGRGAESPLVAGMPCRQGRIPPARAGPRMLRACEPSRPEDSLVMTAISPSPRIGAASARTASAPGELPAVTGRALDAHQGEPAGHARSSSLVMRRCPR